MRALKFSFRANSAQQAVFAIPFAIDVLPLAWRPFSFVLQAKPVKSG